MDHLEKAKLALTHLAELDDLDLTGPLPPVWGRLMEIAQVQAQIAAAESLERIASLVVLPDDTEDDTEDEDCDPPNPDTDDNMYNLGYEIGYEAGRRRRNALGSRERT